MRAFPWHAAEGQVYLPADILARNGVTRDDIVRGLRHRVDELSEQVEDL